MLRIVLFDFQIISFLAVNYSKNGNISLIIGFSILKSASMDKIVNHLSHDVAG